MPPEQLDLQNFNNLAIFKIKSLFTQLRDMLRCGLTPFHRYPLHRSSLLLGNTQIYSNSIFPPLSPHYVSKPLSQTQLRHTQSQPFMSASRTSSRLRPPLFGSFLERNSLHARYFGKKRVSSKLLRKKPATFKKSGHSP